MSQLLKTLTIHKLQFGSPDVIVLMGINSPGEKLMLCVITQEFENNLDNPNHLKISKTQQQT